MEFDVFNLHSFSTSHHCMQKILLFIHANLFNPRSWSLLFLYPGDIGANESLSINYEHKLGYDFTSWKRIKDTFKLTFFSARAERAQRRNSPAGLLPKLRAFYVFLCLVNELLENGNNKSLQKKVERKSLESNKWSDDVRRNLFTLFLLFFNFSRLFLCLRKTIKCP